MKCIVIDDDDISRRVIEDFITRTSFLTLEHSFAGAIEAVNFLKSGNKVNLIFLDIEMPEMTGIDFLNSLDQPPQVIIVSSKEKYALKAFEYHVTDYLLKPVNYARFFKAANKALESFDRSFIAPGEDKEIFVKKSNSLVKVKFDDILWVEALENYVVITTINDKFTIHFTIKAIENQLPLANFKRIHRSFIVNINHVHSIEDNSILIKVSDGKKIIPIGKSYRDKLLKDIKLISK